MKWMLSVMFLLFVLSVHAQDQLPLHYTDHSDTTKPLIVYISGDGGMNGFSNSLIKSLNAKGYAILALDARDYFWHKKEPQEFANAMNGAISVYMKNKKRNSFVVLGYSFGADVAPFLATRLSAGLYGKCKDVILLSPSVNTSFEIKFLDMLGWGNNKGKNVVTELNKLSLPLVLFFGKDENSFPINEVTVRKQVIVMEGGHHYDNDAEALGAKLVSMMK
jgi:type IV secretory pathway VirJ component